MKASNHSAGHGETQGPITDSPQMSRQGSVPNPHSGVDAVMNRHKEAIVGDPASSCPVDFAFYVDVPGRGQEVIDNSPLAKSIAPKLKKF